MKILLINTNTINPPVSPVGLEYLGEYLSNNGIKVYVHDMVFEKNLPGKIRSVNPDFIGIGIRNTDACSFNSKKSFIPQYSKLIKYIKKITSAPVILGGVGFSVMSEEIIKILKVNFGIYGDGEETLLEFIKKFPDVYSLPNLIYIKNGKYIKNPHKYSDIEKYPFKRNLFDNQRYFKYGGMIGVETKRGCPKQCIYCADTVAKGRKIRLRNPENVVEELSILLSKGINYFHICDSEFNIPYEHAYSVCKEIIKKGINKKIKWYCYCSPDGVDCELLKIMKEAGCSGINFGVDSGNYKILKNLKKDFTPDDIVHLSENLQKTGITFMFDLLLGGPGENKDTIKETILIMKKIKPDVVGTAIGVRVYKNTEMETIVRKEGNISRNKNLYGNKINNDNLLKPVFYISPEVGAGIFTLVENIVAGDKRFFFSHKTKGLNYNYDENKIIIKEINRGARGAYWHILKKYLDRKVKN